MLLSLAALWGFAAWVTVRDGWNLLEAGQIDTSVGRPTKSLINMLQDERRLSMIQLGRHGVIVPGLADQRARTDQLVTSWGRTAKDAPDKVVGHVAETRKRLEALTAVRSAVDGGTADRAGVAQAYNLAIDSAFSIVLLNTALDDEGVSSDGRALVALTRARELLAREDAQMAGVIAVGRFTSGEFNRFSQAVGVQRYGMDEATRQLPPADRARVAALHRSGPFTALRVTEDRVLAMKQRAKLRPGVTAAQWQSLTRPVLDRIDQAIDTGGDEVVERAVPVGYGVLARVILVVGLGLFAVLASIVLAFTTARAILRQLNRLRIAAEELADVALPEVMTRLSHGEKVDVAAQAPPLRFGDDEIGRVGRAFNRVQETAITAAVQQAEQRAGFRKTLRNLAQRNQSLVNRQLQMIDRMERREDLAGKELEDLLRLDHLTTRARRNAENLVQLSGGQPTRVWRRPVPILDVIRAAVSEVENYERATFQRIDPAWLRGHAVIDVIRLLAELIENALSFSSPDTTVEISGQMTPNGFAVAIEDKGLGLDPDRLESANHMLATPPEFDVAPEERLGLLVAGLIARRHLITTTLKRSPYGGVTAVVLLPEALFERSAEPERPLVGAGVAAAPAPVPAAAPARPAAVQDPPGRGNLAVLSTARPEAPALVALPTPEPSGSDDEADDEADAGPLPTRPARLDRPAAVPAGGRGGRGGRGGEPEDDDTLTPGGLPIRKPQESLAPALRADAPASDEEPEPEDLGRSPADVQRIMGAYQRGTIRGRAAADQVQNPGESGAGGPDTAGAPEAPEQDGKSGAAGTAARPHADEPDDDGASDGNAQTERRGEDDAPDA
ncbi:nitrate- and nitrite sensing domain-containing protein [Spirillospora sp. NBC_01491]|uniref:nitrate- and nitrite sensing domain-containing protein n=1 Tax=Spirillospora sp. NBC_01491 TaxID=2976007 RepID=UPI002E31C769|nr:nitrate- and nitrite sensing domain-containing protein [Spirillospora sp. NBC_01491]